VGQKLVTVAARLIRTHAEVSTGRGVSGKVV